MCDGRDWGGLPAPNEVFGTARIADFFGDRPVVEVDAVVEAVLIYRDNFALGWSVTMEGEASELLVVDWVNKAVGIF